MTVYINGTTGISGVDGSAGTPALQGTDTNTGISFGSDVIIGSTGGVERFRVDPQGRLAVGTASAAFGAIDHGVHIYGAGPQEGIRLESTNGSTGILEIYAESGGSALDTRGSGYLRFGSASTEFGRWDPSGRFLVGTSSISGGNGTLYVQEDANLVRNCVAVNNTASGTTSVGFFSFYRNGAYTGGMSNTGSTTAFNTSSDYRLKENVVPLTKAINRLTQLQVHRFNFISEPDRTVDGFIAHEAQAVVPECVTGEKDAVDDEGNPIYQGIDQSKLVPLLTAALQEALAEIESLKARVTTLEP
jgi:hypothetical protein